VLIGYNLFLVWAVTGYFMVVTQSKEYAEPEWYADLWLVIVWVAYLVLYLRTLKRRAEPHIYVANWYYLAFIVVVAMLHSVNAAAIPVSFAGAKSYPAFSGVQDAMVQWWYGHNAVAFFMSSGFWGCFIIICRCAHGGPFSLTACRSSAFGGSRFSTSGSARTICTTPLCRLGCKTLA